jgi:glycosyltransferase involved in cell wall biosynthesis
MNEPLVSVITTTFNHGDYIRQCLDSVAAQTYERWEQIVVDDASTDRTASIAESVARANPNVKLVRHTENWGGDRLADSFNEALALSRGDLIAVLDGDDWWAPDRLASQLAVLADESVVLSYADCLEVDGAGRGVAVVSLPVSPESTRSRPEENVAYFSSLMSFPANTVLARRSSLEAIGGFRGGADAPLVDFPTWLELGLKGVFARVPRVLAYWRRHRGSTSWGQMEQMALAEHRVYADFIGRHRRTIAETGDPDVLLGLADRALERKLSSLVYLDAQQELLYGDPRRARTKFVAAATSSKSSYGYRAAAVAGLLASATSPRAFATALAVKRRVFGRRRARR